MANIIYQNFDLLIEREAVSRNYAVKVLRAGGGDARSSFSFTELSLAADAQDIAQGTTNGTAATRDMDTGEDDTSSIIRAKAPAFEQAKNFGSLLFNAVFKPDIYISFKSSMDQARLRNAMVRLRLNLTQVPELANLPWEYLHNAKLNHFYARFINTPLVRYLEQGDPIEALEVTLPLRVLVVISNPQGSGVLDVEREWKVLKESLKDLEAQNLVELERLDKATVEALQDRLIERFVTRPYHIFHFIGHGDFDASKKEGRLLFEHEDGSRNPVPGKNLAELLRDYTTLRLAIINSCEGARTSESDSYNGTVQNLLRHAMIPAVIGMQFEITDTAAISFTKRFYSTLAAGFPVDAALSQARMSIFQSGNEVEWATPVLYLRSDDGNLFSIGTTRQLQVQPLPELGTAPHPLEAHFQHLIDALLKGQLVVFTGLDINLYGRQSDQNWKRGQDLPGIDELAAHLAAKYKYHGSDKPDLAAISQYVAVKERKIAPLYEEISSIFSGLFEPTPVHALLARIPQLLSERNALRAADPLLRRFIIVTSSYDDLLEREFNKGFKNFHVVAYLATGKQRGRFQHTRIEGGRAEPPILIESPNDYRGFSDQDPVIIKLPGTLDTINFDHRFAITEDHFFDYLTHKDLTELLPPQLTSKLKRSGHLFLGYSLRDWNSRALLYRIWDDQKPGYLSWLVHPHPQEADEQFGEACDIEVIQADWPDYISALRERIESIPRNV